MGSKYIFAWNKKHFFNPAGISLVILGLFGSGSAVWWVATPYMLLSTAILGFLVLKKIHRFSMFFSFAIVSFFVITFTHFTSVSESISLIQTILLSWPILFLGTIMLTEPLITPPTERLQVIYGAIVGFLFSIEFHIGPFFSTPELALILGNIFSYVVSYKENLRLSFVNVRKISANIYDFSFTVNKRLISIPGQYMEWTLEHEYPDDRGNRRYFTVASSPTEKYIHLGVRIDPEKSSTFKKKLLTLRVGDTIMTSGLEGDFIMPSDKKIKLVFIVGGVGITPVRSMVHYMSDMKEKRDIVLFYTCMSASDFAFKEELEKMKENIGLRIVYIVTNMDGQNWDGRVGYITEGVIKEEVADYIDRVFYISGPDAMVSNYENILLSMSVDKKNICTDYFPGY
jgi:ferredoxin-NADP reductase